MKLTLEEAEMKICHKSLAAGYEERTHCLTTNCMAFQELDSQYDFNTEIETPLYTCRDLDR